MHTNLYPKTYTLKPNSGFTLIEVVVYVALFAILFGGAIAAAYNVIEGSGRSQTRAMMQEEGEFLLGKIGWVLSGAQTISTPAPNVISSELSVAKYGGTSASIKLNGTDMEITNAGNTYTLNNSTVNVENLNFLYTQADGSGVNQSKITTSFILTGRTPKGQTITLNFSTTSYLRK